MNSSPIHEIEVTKEGASAGKTMEFFRRMRVLVQDEKVREGVRAGVRTLINVGISFADLVPGGPGEVLDVLATVGKYIKSGKISFDLTPDVSSAVNWTANIPELFSAGAFPSYAIPTGLQAIKDVPRMIEGASQAKKIITGEMADYQNNKAAIDAAISAFTN